MFAFDHNMSATEVTVALLLFMNNHKVLGYWSKMTMVSIENVNVTDESPLNANLFLEKIDDNSVGISGNIWTTEQLRDYDAEIAVLHSDRNNTNLYRNTPARYSRKPMCVFFEDFYFRLIMENMKPPVSDMPQVTDINELCALFVNKNFTIAKFLMDPSPIPKFAEPGMYKAIIKVHRREPDRMVSGIDFTLRLD